MSSLVRQPGCCHRQPATVPHPNDTNDTGKQNYSLLASASCSHPSALKHKAKSFLDRFEEKNAQSVAELLKPGCRSLVIHPTSYISHNIQKFPCDCKSGVRELSLSFVSCPFPFPWSLPNSLHYILSPAGFRHILELS